MIFYFEIPSNELSHSWAPNFIKRFGNLINFVLPLHTLLWKCPKTFFESKFHTSNLNNCKTVSYLITHHLSSLFGHEHFHKIIQNLTILKGIRFHSPGLRTAWLRMTVFCAILLFEHNEYSRMTTTWIREGAVVSHQAERGFLLYLNNHILYEKDAITLHVFRYD